MKKYLKSLLVLSVLIIVFGFKNDCGGKERWSVKILTDKESSKIYWLPKHTTVKALTELVQPYPVNNKKFDRSVRFGYEFNVYEVYCKIRQYIREDDGDYHLVLVDLSDTTLTMVGEIPNPDCDSVSKSKYAKGFRETRNEFEKHILPKGKVSTETFIITGVCFFDFIHGQKGVAKNGVEIHPIMDLVKL